MAYTGLEDLNDTSITGLLSFPNLDFPSFWPFIMFGIFVVVTLASYFSEKERLGTGNMLSSLAVGSFVNIVVSVILSMMGLIQTNILIISITISSIFIAIYMLTGR